MAPSRPAGVRRNSHISSSSALALRAKRFGLQKGTRYSSLQDGYFASQNRHPCASGATAAVSRVAQHDLRLFRLKRALTIVIQRFDIYRRDIHFDNRCYCLIV